MTSFVDAIPICEQEGHIIIKHKMCSNPVFGLYIRYESCKRCNYLAMIRQYKWMGEREMVLWN